jgi:hypothetical protein
VNTATGLLKYAVIIWKISVASGIGGSQCFMKIIAVVIPSTLSPTITNCVDVCCKENSPSSEYWFAPFPLTDTPPNPVKFVSSSLSRE